MRFFIKFAGIVVAGFLFSFTALAQGIGVLATGTQGKDFVPFINKHDYRGFSVNGVVPGVEIVFGPRSRVGGSVFYSRMDLSASTVEQTYSFLEEGQPVNMRMTNEQQVKPAQVVGGMIYVNVSPRPGRFMLEPFVGAGGGVGFLKKTSQHTYYKNGVLYERLSPETTKLYAPTTRFVGGVNLFPVKRVMFSVLGGYQYGGPFVEIRGGLAF